MDAKDDHESARKRRKREEIEVTSFGITSLEYHKVYSLNSNRHSNII